MLDSFAMLAYLNGEPGAAQVRATLRRAERGEYRVCMSLINLGEVLYLTERRRGLTAAQRALALVGSLPVEVLPVERPLVLQAAHIKAHHPLAYADAFAAACARQEDAAVLTGDPEFRTVEGLVRVEWLER
ncbi:MAG: type II toxin-antitoxin system VapC family toxin [Anaerolineae bacterium]